MFRNTYGKSTLFWSYINKRMVFSIDQQLCKHLQHLDQHDTETLNQVCQIAFDSLKNGLENMEALPNEDLKELVKGTMGLIIQAIKFGLLDNELNDFLCSMQCNGEYTSKLVQFYQLYKPGLSKILLIHSATSSYKRHVQLHWKIEVKVASKNIREQFVPQIILRFQTKNSQYQTEYFSMQCTPADIFHIVDKLGDALRRNNSNIGKSGVQRIAN